MKIAIDAMGGDSAPEATTKGALSALKQTDDMAVVLVGDENEIHQHLPDASSDDPRLDIQHAPEVIDMGESAVEGIRNKPNASINVCVELVKKGAAQAIVSAGNTGATVSSSTLNLGLLEQIHRPGIATPIPNPENVCLLIDVGANIYCKPHQLLQYGIMASIYQERVSGIDEPKVGLLNIGEEEEKGKDLLQETLPLLQNAPINFVGNVEGQAAFSGDLDVMVTEGFIGNVILKFLEGNAQNMLRFFKNEMEEVSESGTLSRESRKVLQRVKRKTDYSEHGGAPLLGVDGVVIICHGRSGEKAIRNAIKQAARVSEHRINEQILEEISSIQDSLETNSE